MASVSEQVLEKLSTRLSVPLNLLQEVAESDELCTLVEKMTEYVATKQDEAEEYETVLANMSSTLAERDSQIEEYTNAVRSLQDQLTESESRVSQLEQQTDQLVTSNLISQEEEEQRQLAMYQLQEEIDEMKRKKEEASQQLTQQCVLVENLQGQLEQAHKTIEELQPPPDIPGADRTELLRLLSHRQAEVTRFTSEWENLSERLERTSSAKSELQTRIDSLVGQEASVRLREQLLSQEMSLLRQQNDMLSHEVENLSNELLSVRKDKVTVVSALEEKVTLKDHEVSRLKVSLESVQALSAQLQEQMTRHHHSDLEVRDQHAAVEDQLRKELVGQTKLTNLYQSACQQSENKIGEMAKALEQLQTAVGEIEKERDQYRDAMRDLENKLSTLMTENAYLITTLQTELSNANDLLNSARQHGFLPNTEGDLLSLSPSAAGVSAQLRSGLTLTQIYSRYVESCDQLTKEKEENGRLNNYLERILTELDEKTPALQRLRQDHDAALTRCDQLQNRFDEILEECEILRVEVEEGKRSEREKERENRRLSSLTADLSRQVKVLLRECEAARGNVSMTQDDISSSDITSSSQVISDHLVTFRSLEELQDQNQRLLAVVRTLSEEREREEEEKHTQETHQLQEQLDQAIHELQLLREGRERQKETVEAIVQQRDMYRVLLAQSTPLPADNSQLGGSFNSSTLTQDQPSRFVDHTHCDHTLSELKEQFAAYRQEKSENDRILQEKIDEFREQASSVKLDNAKLLSQLEYSKERYQLLDTATDGLRSELAALRDKNTQLTHTLTTHQTTITTLTQELLSSRAALSRCEVACGTLRAEHSVLADNERRVKEQYDQLLRSQRGQGSVMANLQTIQNNLERSEYETRNRYEAQVERLEKEHALSRERVHTLEGDKQRVVEAYEIQLKSLTRSLDDSKNKLAESASVLKCSEERVKGFEEELQVATHDLSEVKSELAVKNNKLREMEEDAGAEFRSRIRVLNHRLADANNKISSLQTQLTSAQEHSHQYEAMSAACEQSLKELNTTSQQFRVDMEEKLSGLKEREEELVKEVEELREEKSRVEERLIEELSDTQEVLRAVQDQLVQAESQLAVSNSTAHTLEEELSIARSDITRYSDLAAERLQLYQRELMQHGHTMEEVEKGKQRERLLEEEAGAVRGELVEVKEELSTVKSSCSDKLSKLEEDHRALTEHCSQLTSQNDLLHSEAERLSAQIVTLTQPHDTSLSSSFSEDKIQGSEQLWEIIRYVRREKEIAETRREMNESECVRLRQQAEHLQRKLTISEQELNELSEAAKSQSDIATQYEEVMTKVHTLNVISDSNRLLRDERDQLTKQVQTLEQRCRSLEGELHPLHENKRTLEATKNSLLAENAALKNEVSRWNTRTNQLIEQYNKVDPDEYEKLLEEKESHEAEMTSLREQVVSLSQQLDSLTSSSSLAQSTFTEELTTLQGEREGIGAELAQTQGELKTLKEDGVKKTEMITKLREVGRKYRSLSEELKKEVEELRAAKLALERRVEEGQQSASAAASSDSDTVNELKQQVEKLTQEVESARQEAETHKAVATDREEKHQKVVKAARALKIKHDAMKEEKEREKRDLENTKVKLQQADEEMKSAEEKCSILQQKLDALRNKHDMTVAKLQSQIKQQTRSRRIPPATTESTPPTHPTSVTAPTAAIKPTVTTTPTASIRPMPLQTTTAPTAHISPTQVTVSFTETTPSITPPTSTPAAAVFVRGTSPLLTATRSQTGPTVHITPTLQTAPQSQPLQTGPTVHITPTLQTAPQSQPLQTGPTVHITPTLQTAPQPQTTIGGTSVGSGSGTTTSDPSVGGATGSGSSVGGVSERPPKRTRPDSAESLSTEPPPASKRLRPLSQTPLVSHPNMEHSTSSQQGNAPAETTPTISETTPVTVQPTIIPETTPVTAPPTIIPETTPVTAPPTIIPETAPVTAPPIIIPETTPVTAPPTIIPETTPVTAPPIIIPETTPVTAPPTIIPETTPVTAPPTIIPETAPVTAPLTVTETIVPSSIIPETTSTEVPATILETTPTVPQETTPTTVPVQDSLSVPVSEELSMEVEGVEPIAMTMTMLQQANHSSDSDDMVIVELEQETGQTGSTSSHEVETEMMPEQEEEVGVALCEDEVEIVDEEAMEEDGVADEEADREQNDVYEEEEEEEDDEEEEEEEDEVVYAGSGGSVEQPIVILSDEEIDNSEEEEFGHEQEYVEEEEEEEEDPSARVFQPPAAEESVGLPDDEMSVDITASSSSQPTASTHRQIPIPGPSLNMRLGLAAERAITPGYELGVITGDDATVPCTPVLAEDKQLSTKPTVQSVPVPARTISSGSSTSSSSGGGVHSIEDTQIDQLTASSLTVPPPPDNTLPLSPNDIAAPTAADYVTGEVEVGDINDDIRQIIAAGDELSEDEEESEEVEEKQDTLDVEEGEVVEEPSAAVPLPTDQSDPTASGQQSPPGMDERVPRPRIQPIVWTPPASAAGSTSGAAVPQARVRSRGGPVRGGPRGGRQRSRTIGRGRASRGRGQ